MWETLKETFLYIPWIESFRFAVIGVALFNFWNCANNRKDVACAIWFFAISWLVFGAK